MLPRRAIRGENSCSKCQKRIYEMCRDQNQDLFDIEDQYGHVMPCWV